MPTPSKGPRLGGSSAHEKLMLANLATSLFEHESIRTTENRAKRLRPLAEKLITLGKRGDLHARRKVMETIGRKDIVAKLFEDLAPKFAERPGGYTRITKIANRKGDDAPMAIIELVLEPVSPKQAVVAEAETATKTAAKKAEAAEKAEEPTAEEAEEPTVEKAEEPTVEKAEEPTAEEAEEPTVEKAEVAQTDEEATSTVVEDAAASKESANKK